LFKKALESSKDAKFYFDAPNVIKALVLENIFIKNKLILYYLYLSRIKISFL
jgi:hypothetical protein